MVFFQPDEARRVPLHLERSARLEQQVPFAEDRQQLATTWRQMVQKMVQQREKMLDSTGGSSNGPPEPMQPYPAELYVY